MSTFTEEDHTHLASFDKELATVPNVQMQEKKLILVGDGGTGKTTFVKRLMADDFDPKYLATLGVEVHPVVDQERNIIYNIWDTAGQEKFGGSKDAYYINADLAIVMYDTTRIITANSVKKWISDIQKVCPKIPIIII
jgi:GTP-binding nuclear protein Ran